MSQGAWLAILGAAFWLCQCAAPVAQSAARPALRKLSSTTAGATLAAAVPEAAPETLDQIRRRLLEEQDTDCDQRITREDGGSRRFRFRWQDQAYELSGGYVLSNLLEELTLDLKSGESPQIARVMEDPIGRFSRVFATSGWDALSRRVDESGLPALLEDPKLSQRPERTLYVPADDRRALAYFQGVAERYNGAQQRLAPAVVALPLLALLSDASADERAQELVALLRTPEGRRSLGEARQRLGEGALELGHPALAEHYGQALASVDDLVGRAELPCVQTSAPRLTQIARRLSRELATFMPHALRVRPLPASDAESRSTRARAAPGMLSLALRADGTRLSGVPFIAPGGGAEQMNGWHSYFILLGLLQDGRLEQARELVDNFVYAVERYQATLHANRSYYLARSEPPFLSSMVRAVWEATPAPQRDLRWLRRARDAAVLEYRRVWGRVTRPLGSLCQGEGESRVCLSRYSGTGSGQPPEVEPGSFDWLWQEFGRSLEASYVAGQLQERDLNAELDRAFRNDRCMRESGHEATYRWFWPLQPSPSGPPAVNRCADMVSVDLNSLLYKYEVDLARLEALLGSDPLPWCARAAQRFTLMKKLLWSARDGLFYDAFLAPEGPVPSGYVSATALYPLWATAETCEVDAGAGRAAELSAQEKSALVTNALAQLEAPGGLLASARAARERFSARADRGWDYPNGWAPHQMLAWRALEAHGFHEDAQRLAFSWLYMLLTQVIDYDGSTLDKYDVVERSRPADFDPSSEHGDLARSGFAWTNASFQVGLALLDPPQRARLAQAIASGRPAPSSNEADQ